MDQQNMKGSDKNQEVDFEFTTTTQLNKATHIASLHKSTTSSSSNLSLEIETFDEEDIDSSLDLKQPSLLSQEPSLQTPGWSTQSASSTTSSQFPMNGKSEGYDPNRIPTSVFNSKPSNPMEWSVASNESLFSIHVGNNSFSTESFLLMQKSGDLTNVYMKTEEMVDMPIMLSPNDRRSNSNEHIDLLNTLPRITEGKVLESNNLVSDKAREITENSTDQAFETKKINLDESPTQNNREKMPHADENRHSTCVSHVSDESCTSANSFHFPV